MASSEDCRYRSDLKDEFESGPAVVATPGQILAGHPVGPRSDSAVCIGCGGVLHEADIVFAYAYRCVESTEWNVPRLFCRGCAPNRIRSPTLGTAEVLVGGRLGTITVPTLREHRLCLTELAVRAVSRPTEGSAP